MIDKFSLFFKKIPPNDKDVLTVYTNYGFDLTGAYGKYVHDLDNCNYFWKVFVNTPFHLKELKQNQPLKGKNIVVSGSAKMDALSKVEIKERKRKCIILAPHHSVSGGANKVLNISNFFKYADFFVDLPKKYPDIDFVFRPHPALFDTLSQDKFWGKDKVANYISKITANKNLIYYTKGDTSSVFLNSDGLIHDCGGFLENIYLLITLPFICWLIKIF